MELGARTFLSEMVAWDPYSVYQVRMQSLFAFLMVLSYMDACFDWLFFV